MLDNPKAASRWVKLTRRTPEQGSSTPASLDARLAAAQHSWSALWCAPAPAADALDGFFEWVPEGGYPCSLPPTSADSLYSAARRAKSKGAGIDEWLGAHFACLPPSAFIPLALLWDAILLRRLPIPTPWLHVRVVLVPKKDNDGMRPISVASLAWRLCMGVTLRSLTPWLNTWVDSQLCGGLAMRDARALHCRLLGDSAIAKGPVPAAPWGQT